MPDSSPANTRPIELLTENGFSILRLWEIDRVPPPMAGNYHFLVRNPQSLEREIIVEIAADAVVQIGRQTRGRILPCSSFWICCAERHLATYLWENDDYPLGDGLWVKELDPEDCMTAIRWQTT
jgi:hypothetical protein